MKPEVKYPKKSTYNRVCDNYYRLVKSIINRHIGLNWNECLLIIKKHVPEKYMYIAKDWFPDRVNRNGDLHKGWGGITSKERLTRPFMYPIIYIDEDNIIRETPKAKILKSKKQDFTKVKQPNYWDPRYKIDFEITTNSTSYLSLLKYWQSPLLRERVALDLEGNPKGILLNWMCSITSVSIKDFIEFCEKNKYTYRIIEGGNGVFGWRSIRYHYKPYYND